MPPSAAWQTVHIAHVGHIPLLLISIQINLFEPVRRRLLDSVSAGQGYSREVFDEVSALRIVERGTWNHSLCAHASNCPNTGEIFARVLCLSCLELPVCGCAVFSDIIIMRYAHRLRGQYSFCSTTASTSPSSYVLTMGANGVGGRGLPLQREPCANVHDLPLCAALEGNHARMCTKFHCLQLWKLWPAGPDFRLSTVPALSRLCGAPSLTCNAHLPSSPFMRCRRHMISDRRKPERSRCRGGSPACLSRPRP